MAHPNLGALWTLAALAALAVGSAHCQVGYYSPGAGSAAAAASAGSAGSAAAAAVSASVAGGSGSGDSAPLELMHDVADYGVYDPTRPKPRALSKLPVFGRVFYDTSQRDYHRLYKAEKDMHKRARGLARDYKKQAPKKFGIRTKTDEMLVAKEEELRHKHNMIHYKNKIKNKIPLYATGPKEPMFAAHRAHHAHHPHHLHAHYPEPYYE